jgi:hypothetical protein
VHPRLCLGAVARPLNFTVRPPMRLSSSFALLLCMTALASCRAVPPAEILTQQDACSLLKKRIAKLENLAESGPAGLGWFCDFSTLDDNQWYVIALRSNRHCDGICSDLMGWYAVNRASGSVHQYDVAELRVGVEVNGR